MKTIEEVGEEMWNAEGYKRGSVTTIFVVFANFEGG